MDKIIDIMLCSGVVLTELILIIIAGLLIQLIMYQVFNINLVKIAVKTSRKLDNYLNSKLYL